MKTQPEHKILPIPLEPELQNVMDLYYEAIHEMVCFGTTMLAPSFKGDDNAQNATLKMAAPLLFRHILELLDAISVQLKSAMVIPCKVHLRAALEAVLSLEYLLKENTLERSACFFIADYYRILNQAKKYLPNTEENTKYLKEMQDSSLDYGNTLVIEGAQEAYDGTLELINRPEYREANEEYLRYTNQNKKRLDKWYTLHKGPNSFSGLAKELNRVELYNMFYKAWSDPIHGTNLWQGGVLSVSEKGHKSISQIRNPVQAQLITETACMVGFFSFSFIGGKLSPEEQRAIGEWTVLFQEGLYKKVRETNIPFVNISWLD